MTAGARPRFRFGAFVVWPSRRVLLHDGVEIPLIPRYFDLLVLLLERRAVAVSRREILDAVWTDVVVSDGALSQAVRILRRTLGDDPRSPAFIRTVSRHGYRFVFPDVVEEPDGAASPASARSAADAGATAAGPAAGEPPEALVERLLAWGRDPDPAREDEAREIAERLHAGDLRSHLEALDRREGHPAARALLRDARWDLPDAKPVPVLGRPAAARTLAFLLRLRLRRVWRIAGRRWLAAAGGAGLAGALGGAAGALVLLFGPGSAATPAVLLALPLYGVVAGAVGGAGVGGGLSVAEVWTRSRRGPALVGLGTLAGGATAWTAHLLASVLVAGLFGRDLSPVAGGFEGAAIGGAVGLGYALATRRSEGMATPRGAARITAAAATGLVCLLATSLLAARGSFLGALSLDFLARSFPGSQVGIGPLARLLGEATPGLLTRIVVSAWEGLLFGSGLALGLTRRPR